MAQVSFRTQLSAWLNRSIGERGTNAIPDLRTILSTDCGLIRRENQDRLALMHYREKSKSTGIVAIALADGMGGMRDGGQCASLAVSAFFEYLTTNPYLDCERHVAQAATFANRNVHSFASGNGGATLSAIVRFSDDIVVTVNIGDSRIYTFKRGEIPRRITIDDSMAEAVGGYGRELIQFIGMGDGIKPHTKLLNYIENVLITSDGIHYLDPILFEEVISNAPTNRSISERLGALARWLGSPDNASIAVVDLDETISDNHTLFDDYTPFIRIWDPFSNLSIILPEIVGSNQLLNAKEDTQDVSQPNQRKGFARTRLLTKSAAKRKKTRKLPQKPSHRTEPGPEVQFEIDVNNARGKSDDDDRK